MERHLDEALTWAAEVVGGSIVHSREHLRWRPQYFLDIDTPQGVRTVVLRGCRDFGQLDQDEAGARARNRREAGVLRALHGAGIPVPKCLGYHEAGSWILMEFLPGTDQLTALVDRELQCRLFREYLDAMVQLHRLDPDALELPADLDRPLDAEDCIRRAYRHRLRAYVQQDGDPDPLWTYALSWLERNRPAPVERFSMCTGDMGVDQFFFDAGRFTAIIDLENTYISDPLRDIGMMRYRDMLYPLPGMGEHLRYFGEVSRRCVTDLSLHFWTILGMLGSSPAQRTILSQPNPKFPREMSLLLAMTPTRRRGCAEAFHHLQGWPVPARSPRPAAVEDRLTRFPRFVRDELDEYYLPSRSASEAYTMRLTRAHAEMAVLANMMGPQIARENVADLAALLGRQPATELEGLAQLEQRGVDYAESRLHEFMGAMYRIECRNEYLYEPLMHATGLAFGSPLARVASTST